MSKGPPSQRGPHKSSRFDAWCKHKNLPSDIDYSDKYLDDEHEFRHVILSAPAFKKLAALYKPEGPRLLNETEWRSLGLTMTAGWVHYAIHQPELYIMLFRRSLVSNKDAKPLERLGNLERGKRVVPALPVEPPEPVGHTPPPSASDQFQFLQESPPSQPTGQLYRKRLRVNQKQVCFDKPTVRNSALTTPSPTKKSMHYDKYGKQQKRCSCGSMVSLSNLDRHKKTLAHFKALGLPTTKAKRKARLAGSRSSYA